jgi:SAM-dependent methyltransferase
MDHESRKITSMNQHVSDTSPSPWVCRFASLIPAGGEVLDLACGAGRHARYLATRGYRVEAVDREEGLLAGLAGVAGIVTRRADLEGGAWPYYGRQFDGIVVTNYLWRPLLPSLMASVAEGGVLIYETFMAGNERFGSPSNPQFLLRRGELLDLMHRRFTVVAFEQGEVRLLRPAVVQRICVRRGGDASLPESAAPVD